MHTGPSLARTMADTESAVAELPPAGVRPRHTTLSPHNAGETRVRSSGSNGGSGSTLGLTSFTHQQTRDVQTRREVVFFTTRTLSCRLHLWRPPFTAVVAAYDAERWWAHHHACATHAQRCSDDLSP